MQILRGEGHDEVVDEEEIQNASDTSITTWKADPLDSHLPVTSRSSSPPARYTKYPPQKNDPQTIYEVRSFPAEGDVNAALHCQNV